MLLALAQARAIPAQTLNGANPHGRTRLTLECNACHTTAGWRTLRRPLDFDHSKQTRFTLGGRHATVACGGCHLDLRYDQPQLSQSDCASCHLDVHQGRQSGDCASCHNTLNFRDAGALEQHARGRFALTGAHVQISCESCHQGDRGGSFTPLASECVSCHQSDYTAARSVDHVKAGLPRECRQCHGTAAWHGAAFDHAAVAAGFSLDGKHAQVACASCHQPDGSLVFPKPASRNDCVSCHRADYDEEHRRDGFPLDCASCHTVNGWEREAFDHAAVAKGFELLGKHATTACTECHVMPGNTLRFHAANQNDCVSCHRTQYDGEHGGSGYPLKCATCHNVNGWSATFDHAALARGFALIGAHERARCTECHSPTDNALTVPKAENAEDCVACHRPEYDREHTGTGFPLTCRTCHDANDWARAVFDHAAAASGFALVGAHDKAACQDCHVQPGNALKFPKPATSDDCAACHRSDYDRVHPTSGYPMTCLTCHTNVNWATSAFVHEQVANGFALEGAHTQVTCASCHGPNNVLVFPKPANVNDCVACHRTDYDREHTGSHYPLTCLTCHTNATFLGATFNHDAQWFPIYSGEHRGKWTACQDCHPSATDFGAFTCLSCHEHNKTKMDDKHKNMQGYAYVSTTCMTCHPQGKK
jgi:hypothetical protein